MEPRKVFKAVYQPMTLLGVDRRALFVALIMGAATFNLFASFVGGILTGLFCWFAAWLIQRSDPRMIDIFIAARKQRTAYDAGKRIQEDRTPW